MAQSTWFVDVNAPAGGDGSAGLPYNSIQTGIAHANTISGDTLSVLPGQYLESLNYLGKNLNIVSTGGAANTVVSGSGGSVVVLANGEQSARLEGFLLRDGTGTAVGPNTFGGGIYLNASTLTVVNCEVRESDADSGGGIFAGNGAALTLQLSGVLSNTARGGAGVYADGAAVFIQESLIRLNVIDANGIRQGAGLYSGATGSLTVVGTTIQNNRIHNAGRGGGVFTSTPSAVFLDCEISGNKIDQALGFPSFQAGGGVFCDGSAGALQQFTDCLITGNGNFLGSGGGVSGDGFFDNCTISNNRAVSGGGTSGNGTYVNCLIESNVASPLTGECVGIGGGVKGGTYTNCTIADNETAALGGGAHGATLIGCVIDGNRNYGGCDPIGRGAGIANCIAQDCLIVNNQFTANLATFADETGGAGAIDSTLTNCEIRDNTIVSNGHIVFGAGALNCDLTDCLIQGNTIDATDGRGGKGAGLYGGSATNCTILDNETRMVSSGMFAGPSLGGGAAKTALRRCVIAGNKADRGAGAWGSTVVEHCTFANNVAALDGGAISDAPGLPGSPATPFNVTNSILWGNSPDETGTTDVASAVTWSDIKGGFVGAGNISMDPLFWGPGNNGDFRLRPGSPCIDAGNPASPNDPDGSRADMGVFPFSALYVGVPDTYCQAKENSAGCVPTIGYTGSPSLTGPDDFIAGATEMVANKPTIAIWSQAQGNAPFFGGTLCVAPSIQRTTPVGSGGTTGCTGVGSYHFSQSYMTSQGLLAGDRVFLQFWQRDPAHVDGTGVGLSNGLDFTLVP